MTTEGYCDTCHFIIDLTDEGRLRSHGVRRKADSTGWTTACAGTGTFPKPMPGPEAEAAAFKDAPPPGRCPVCGKKPPVTDGLWGRHSASDQEPFCRGSWTQAD